jgi:hypothetical protein
MRAGLQQTMDRYAALLNAGDVVALEQLVHPDSTPLRRLLRNRFRGYTPDPADPAAFTVTTVTPRIAGYVVAHIIDVNGTESDRSFKEHTSQWLFAEPSADELGEATTRQHGDTMRITYFPSWHSDAELLTIIQLHDEAAQRVHGALGITSSASLELRIKPSFGLPPLMELQTAALYLAGNARVDSQIVINAPGSHAFPGYRDSWQAALSRTLTHELTHFVADTAIMPIAQTPPWMAEGLAEVVTQTDRTALLQEALRTDTMLPLVAVDRRDLDHFDTLDERLLAYACSQALVEFIIAQHGGLKSYWALAAAHQTAPGVGEARWNQALQQSLGISLDDFQRAWQAWLRQRYG